MVRGQLSRTVLTQSRLGFMNNQGGRMTKLSWFLLCIWAIWGVLALGQSIPAPLPEDANIGHIFAVVVNLFSQEGLSYQYIIASVLFVMVSFFKMSSMRALWDKLGKWKPFVAPTLSLIAFAFLIRPFTLQAFIAAITTGAAAGYFSQLIDALKTIPSIGFIFEVLGDIVKKISGRDK